MKLYQYANDHQIRNKQLLDELEDEGYPLELTDETTEVPRKVLRKIDQRTGSNGYNGTAENTWRERLEKKLTDWTESSVNAMAYTIGTVKLLTDEDCASTRQAILQELKHIGRDDLGPLEERTYSAIQFIVYWPEKISDQITEISGNAPKPTKIGKNLRNRIRGFLGHYTNGTNHQ